MMLSEAVEAVADMLDAFPNGTPQNPTGYIGSLSAVLMDYPRSIAMRCCDKRRGVARETRFLPTVADIVGWCERETAELRTPVEREDAEDAVIRRMSERRERHAAIEAERQSRLNLDQLKVKYGDAFGIGKPAKKIDVDAPKQPDEAMLAKANRVGFERACLAAGWPKDSPYSPLLVKALEERGVITPATTPLQR